MNAGDACTNQGPISQTLTRNKWLRIKPKAGNALPLPGKILVASIMHALTAGVAVTNQARLWHVLTDRSWYQCTGPYRRRNLLLPADHKCVVSSTSAHIPQFGKRVVSLQSVDMLKTSPKEWASADVASLYQHWSGRPSRGRPSTNVCELDASSPA
jgi:hypothetical protein